MRRPSIPFEAIGLGYRTRLAVRALGELNKRQQEKTMTQPDPREPNQVPDGDLKKNIGDVPPSIADDIEDDDEDDEDSTGFDDDE